MWVCFCHGVSNTQIDDVLDLGASTLDDVTSACGAGGDCGRCRPTIEAQIDARGRLASSVV